MLRRLLWVAAAALGARATFVPTPTGFTHATGHAGTNVRYKRVPDGICGTSAAGASYAGYVDVAADEHMFFWLFSARDEPETKPLTVWLNGGPGSSSMIGLFQEIGPCTVFPNGSVHDNVHAWTASSNVLFIDQPVTVGLSYSRVAPAVFDEETLDVRELRSAECPPALKKRQHCGTFSLPRHTHPPKTTRGSADSFWRTLQGFYGAFPQYASRALHLASESYGGHYVPAFAHFIHSANAHLPRDSVRVPLASVLIGNGWFDPAAQYRAYYDYAIDNTFDVYALSAAQREKMHTALFAPDGCLDRLRDCRETRDNRICRKSDAFCAASTSALFEKASKRDLYDIRERTPDPFPYGAYARYLNTREVQEAVGAYQNYTDTSGIVAAAFERTGDDGRRAGSLKSLRELLDRGTRVTLFAGDADYMCNWVGIEAVTQMLGHANFSHAGYTDFRVNDTVYGHVQQAGLLSFARIFESGHEVPFYQPLAGLALLSRALDGTDIATGRVTADDSYITRGPAKSEYREGNATVQWDVLPPSATYDTARNRPVVPDR